MVTYLDDSPLLGFYSTLIGSYRRFGTAWPLKMEPVVVPKRRRLTANQLCVTCQNRDDLMYTATEV
jgi:hypothetical protein